MLGDETRRSVASKLLAMRAERKRSFPSELFDEHGWNMLLCLFVAMVDNRTLSEAALIRCADVRPAVGSRWLAHLVSDGQIEPTGDGRDILLTKEAISRMRTFLDRTGRIQARPA